MLPQDFSRGPVKADDEQMLVLKGGNENLRIRQYREECPAGSDVFQMTFCLGPNSVGRLPTRPIPVPFGPRNWVQPSLVIFFARAQVSRTIASKMSE